MRHRHGAPGPSGLQSVRPRPLTCLIASLMSTNGCRDAGGRYDLLPSHAVARSKRPVNARRASPGGVLAGTSTLAAKLTSVCGWVGGVMLMPGEHPYFAVISRLDWLRIYDARTGRRSGEVHSPADVVRFTGVAAGDGVYFVSCHGRTYGGDAIGRVDLTVDGKPDELMMLHSVGRSALGNVVGNTISASPDGSHVICATSVVHRSFPPPPVTYAMFLPGTGEVRHRTSRWSGHLGHASWSASGRMLAFLLSSGLPPEDPRRLRWHPGNGEVFGIRVCDAFATDLLAESTLVAPDATAMGLLGNPVLSGDGTWVYAVAWVPDPKDVDRGERSHLRLVRFPVGSGEAEVLLDRVPVSIGEEAGFVRVCRDVEGNNLMLFGRHRGLFRRLRKSAERLRLRWFRGMLPGAGGSQCA
jgi:hypothetical protein